MDRFLIFQVSFFSMCELIFPFMKIVYFKNQICVDSSVIIFIVEKKFHKSMNVTSLKLKKVLNKFVFDNHAFTYMYIIMYDNI